VLATTLIIVGVCGLLAMVVGAFFVGQPMRKLVDVSQRIGAGELSAKTLLRQRDEIGELSRAMDRMGDQLLRAKTQLEAETEARVRSVEQLRHADRLSSIGTLSSGIAHELGTPLAVISGRAELIADGSVEGETVRTYAQSIAKQAKKMTEIIRQLLDFARRSRSTLSPKNVAKVAEITVSMLRSLAAKKNIQLSLRSSADDAQVAADAVQLQQVLTNLIVNAIQAMPGGGGGGGAITINVERQWASPPVDHEGQEGTYIRIAVRDEGSGIPPDVQAKIFEPFFTTKPVGQGTGLGLAVSYGIVREHGGWIEVESEVGKGSCFSVYLPLQSSKDELQDSDHR
jgi:signal transduction histidine kinase